MAFKKLKYAIKTQFNEVFSAMFLSLSVHKRLQSVDIGFIQKMNVTNHNLHNVYHITKQRNF